MPVRPFSANQFTMPFEDSFGLEDAEHVAQFLGALPRDAFQLNGEKREGEFLGVGNAQWLIQLTLDDLELPAQQEDL
jgi:hypothetical protein